MELLFLTKLSQGHIKKKKEKRNKNKGNLEKPYVAG